MGIYTDIYNTERILIRMELDESIRSAREKYLKTGLVDQDTFDMAVDYDPTKTKKYVEWILKQYTSGKATSRSDIKQFDQLAKKGLITNKDINSYDSDSLTDTVRDAGKKTTKRTEKKDRVFKHQVEKVMREVVSELEKENPELKGFIRADDAIKDIDDFVKSSWARIQKYKGKQLEDYIRSALPSEILLDGAKRREAITKSEDRDDIDVIHEDDKVIVYFPRSKDASIMYGDSDWCISYPMSKGNRFREYTQNGQFYFVIPKSNIEDKVAVQVDKASEVIGYWDKDDVKRDYTWFVNYLDKYGIDLSVHGKFEYKANVEWVTPSGELSSEDLADYEADITRYLSNNAYEMIDGGDDYGIRSSSYTNYHEDAALWLIENNPEAIEIVDGRIEIQDNDAVYNAYFKVNGILTFDIVYDNTIEEIRWFIDSRIDEYIPVTEKVHPNWNNMLSDIHHEIANQGGFDHGINYDSEVEEVEYESIVDALRELDLIVDKSVDDLDQKGIIQYILDYPDSGYTEDELLTKRPDELRGIAQEIEDHLKWYREGNPQQQEFPFPKQVQTQEWKMSKKNDYKIAQKQKEEPMIKEDDKPINPVDIKPEDYLITTDDQKDAILDMENYQHLANYHMQQNYNKVVNNEKN